MSRTGVFFEVGGYGAYACYLSEWDWVAASRRRMEVDGKELLVPLDFGRFYDKWDVYYVEPLAKNMNWLQREVSVHYPESHFIQVAVGGYDRFEELEVVDIGKVANGFFGSDYAASIMGSSLFNESMPETILPGYSFYTHVVTLDTLFKNLGVYPNVLRLDVEGAEVDVLLSYSFDPKPRIIQVDAHKVNSDDCCDILGGYGYTIVDTCWGDFDDDIYAELSL